MAAGLSLGEYTALTFAGVFQFEDALRVVQQRGEAMQFAADQTPSGMVSILGMELEQVESLCRDARCAGETLEVANLLCPGNIVISGHRTACARASQLAPERGGKVFPLNVAGAFHTDIMNPAVAKLRDALQAVTLRTPRLPVVFNVDAQVHTDPAEIRDLLVRQVVSPVRWEASVRTMLASGVDSLFEVGPGRVLRGLMKRIDRKVACDGVTV